MKRIATLIAIFSIACLIIASQEAMFINESGDVEIYGDLAVNGVSNASMPRGGIIMWSGATSEIPEGWALCDGSNGTPDLRGRFIAGYDPLDADYDEVEETGGEREHTLSVDETPEHSHGVNDPGHNHNDGEFNKILIMNNSSTVVDTDRDNPYSEPNLADCRSLKASETNISIQTTGGSQPHENRPPYYVLAFIIKL